jgi:hypothetical protein
MISRRDFLKTMGTAAGAALLNACARGFDLWGTNEGAPNLPAGTSVLPASASPATFVPPSATPSPVSGPTGTPITVSTPTPFTMDAVPQSNFPFWMQTPTGGPDSRLLCFVLWDHQLAMYGYRPRSPRAPVPETVPLKSGATNRLNKAWEQYWRGILQLCNPGMGKDHFEQSWKGLIADARAFTNGSGPDSGNFGIHSLTCGGATHQMVTGVREGDYMRIYTLNIHDRPPAIPNSPHDIDMTRHFFATTGSNVKLADGSYAVYGFPQFENCIVPLVSPDDTDLIEVSRIKVVTSMQSPYNLEPVECYVPFGCTATPEPPRTPVPGLPEGWPWPPSSPTP